MNHKYMTDSGRSSLRIIQKLLFVTLLTMQAGFAQAKSDPVRELIRRKPEQMLLRDFIKLIEQTTEYRFFFSDKEIDVNQSVTVQSRTGEVLSLLDQTLKKSAFTYRLVHNHIILKPRKPTAVTVVAKTSALDTVRIRGRVLDQKEPPGPLPGVTVIVKGTTQGVTTDVDGFFDMGVKAGDLLVFSYVGFTTKEYTVTGRERNLTISLEENVNALNEIVVTGFSEQKVKYLASSVSTVDLSNVNNKPITQLSQALQGGTTGINVAQGSGLPGGDAASIKIRGIGSLLGSSPLVLVDGVPFDMNKLDPNTIETISILKDAAAASVYGARAGNGVILITTKRGVAGKVDVQYNGFYGIQTPISTPDFVDAPTYMRMVNEARRNTGGDPTYSEEVITNTASGTDPNRNPNTNWGKLLLKQQSPLQQHALLVSGGNSTARFSLSANYLKQDGLVTNSGFNRATVRANTSVDLRKDIVVFMDLFASRDAQMEPYAYGGNTSRLLNWIFTAPPNIMAKFPEKPERPGYSYYGTYGESWNPLAQVEKGGITQRIRDEVLINLRPKWDINRDLTLKGQFSYRVSSGADKTDREAFVFFDYFTNDKAGWDYGTIKSAGPTNRSSYYYAGGNLDYTKNFGNHRLNVLGGYSQEMNNADAWQEINLISFFGKAYYSYNDRYLVELGMRRDGSSLFAPNRKWGNFPSMAVGWNVSNEAFLKDLPALSQFKIRGSYGKLGNNAIAPYRYQSTINTGNGTENSIGNPNITWEKVGIIDIGGDLSLFDRQLDVTFDWYSKRTDDLILSPQPTLTSALLTGPLNIGSVKNTGWELKVGYTKTVAKDISFSINLGYSRNRSEWLKLSQETPIINGNNIWAKGQAITEYYGFRSMGLIQQGDIDKGIPIFSGQQTGDIRYEDVNKDGVINNDDRVLLGPTDPLANYFGNLSFKIKNFDFEALLTGVGNVAAFYTGRIALPLNVSGEGGTPLTWHLDYWTPENTGARFPRLMPAPGNNGLLSDFWQVNGAFARVKYIQLGYTIPATATSRIGVKTARIYFNAQNPLTFTQMKIIDPETKGDQGTHPLFKIYSLGLNIRF
ncbi:TonB-linked SusC/RagA family outer membrane protein [Larkinella arboricola]|uniref:TonB-linked SusC/RagA family outer membrane protein n=1 Tax=Larkinella arboricola TaxID=643671 RepID=A0A327WTD3_LARAB|nr:TonB-dependent receptor [Larkinella arboricola]RAJ95640.1 TonB-linked SusC/RagA family outer membrane protein [Larkinella arboricola]